MDGYSELIIRSHTLSLNYAGTLVCIVGSYDAGLEVLRAIRTACLMLASCLRNSRQAVVIAFEREF